MVLNICSCIGVSACACCSGVESEVDGSLVGGGGWAGAGWCTSRAAASLWTSSFRTRPSLPVPVTSAMLTSSSFRSPRTAGVANNECCLDVEGPCASPPVSLTFTAFAPCCSAMSCGCGADGEEPACLAGGVVRASSSGEISLWMSISQRGYRQTTQRGAFVFSDMCAIPCQPVPCPLPRNIASLSHRRTGK